VYLHRLLTIVLPCDVELLIGTLAWKIISNFSFVQTCLLGLLLEMGQEVGPHYMGLIYVRALGLTHGDEMVNKQFSIVFTHSACFI